jgi:two-component system osmolarity sensor histidine kinase EnvZ
MTSIDFSRNGIRTMLAAAAALFARIRRPFTRLGLWLTAHLPKGLYARSLLIIVTPMVLLQSVVAFVFMERHFNQVTLRLSASVAQDVAALVEIYEKYPQGQNAVDLRKIATEKLKLTMELLPPDPLPPSGPKPFFDVLDSVLSQEIARLVDKPFWIDTVGDSNLVEIRVQLDKAVMRVFARRSQTYASNSHIFLVWMVRSSFSASRFCSCATRSSRSCALRPPRTPSARAAT